MNHHHLMTMMQRDFPLDALMEILATGGGTLATICGQTSLRFIGLWQIC